MEIFKDRKYLKTYYNYFIKRCRETRLEYKISQKKFAKSIGVSQSLISFFENGKLDSSRILIAYIYTFGIHF